MAASATRIRTTTAAVIDDQACRGCGSCVVACPEGVLELGDASARVVRPEACLGEGHCLYVCPEGAIHLETSHVLRAV